MNDLIKHYKILLKLAKDEKEILLNDNFEALSDVLDKKDRCIEEIKNVEAVNKNKGGVRDTDLNNKLKTIIKETILIEDENYKIMSEKKDIFKDRLNDIYKGKKSLSGYSTSYQTIPRFVDIKR